MRALLGIVLTYALQGAVIPVTDPALFFSPYNTASDGDGVPLPNNVRSGSTRAEWIYPGAYLKTVFHGASAALLIDIRTMAGAMPRFEWSVDGGPTRAVQVQAGATRVPLAENLPVGPHSLTVYFAASDANYDRWRAPVQVVRILGLEATAVSAPANLHPKRVVFFGDSITEGAWILGNSNRVIDKKYVDWVAHSDATLAWPRLLAAALDAEYGTCGSGGMGWLRASHSEIPALPESWRFHYKDHRRDFAPAPDLVIVNMGTNDGARDTTAAAEQWLRDVRKALPQARIAVIIPFNQANRAQLELAITRAADPGTVKIDLGPRWAEGLQRYGQASAVSFDGLHPNATANGQFAALLAARIAAYFPIR